jgi:predicted oxidoreductase
MSVTSVLPSRPLGRPGEGGVQVSRIALGCMGLSGTWNPAEFDAAKLERGVGALRAAWEAGITFFDFADIYGRGTCEQVWPEAVARVPGLGERAVVCTKVGIRLGSGDDPYRYDHSFAYVLRAVDASLRRLGSERVDLLLLHRPDPLTHPREVARALNTLVRSGKVGAVGVSNYTPAQIRALQAFLDFPLAASQPSFSLWNLRPLEDGTLDICEELDLLPMAYSPLAGGLLAGRRELRPDDPARERLEGLRAELRRQAEVYGCTPTQVALAWLLAHPAGVVPVVGSTDPEHIREAAGACRIRLGREDWYRLWVAARGSRLP